MPLPLRSAGRSSRASWFQLVPGPADPRAAGRGVDRGARPRCCSRCWWTPARTPNNHQRPGDRRGIDGGRRAQCAGRRHRDLSARPGDHRPVGGHGGLRHRRQERDRRGFRGDHDPGRHPFYPPESRRDRQAVPGQPGRGAGRRRRGRDLHRNPGAIGAGHRPDQGQRRGRRARRGRRDRRAHQRGHQAPDPVDRHHRPCRPADRVRRVVADRPLGAPADPRHGSARAGGAVHLLRRGARLGARGHAAAGRRWPDRQREHRGSAVARAGRRGDRPDGSGSRAAGARRGADRRPGGPHRRTDAVRPAGAADQPAAGPGQGQDRSARC